MPSILLVGCGNSALPRVLHDAFGVPVRVTCLDYSSVCIELVKSMYGESCPNMDFAVGDATALREVQWESDDGARGKQSPTESDKVRAKKHFDVVIDKGLLDALMCGDGFDLEKLVTSVNSVLTPREWGMHVLVCFPLSRSTKQSLDDLGNSSVPNLAWEFDIPVKGSENGRARFNLGFRCSRRGVVLESTRGLQMNGFNFV